MITIDEIQPVSQSVKETQCHGMRNYSVYMKVFKDIANYIENTDEPNLDIFAITSIMSKEHGYIR